MQTDFILKSFIYTSILLNIYIIKSIPVNEPNVFYVNDDTNEGQRIGRITHFNGNQQANFKIGNTKAVIVRGNRPPAIYFRLNENTGDLYTRTIIDHEALCSKQSQIVGNLNNIPTNNDFTETNYQYRSLLSSTSNSKIIQQCKFTFQVALHRTLLSDQSQKTDHFIEPGYPNLPEFIDIHIIIIDRNDHSPIFQPHSMINISIPELVPIGTRIQLPLAYDPDSPEYSIQRYELYPITINDFALYIQTTDIIYNTNIIQEITGLYLEVKTLLDRELRDSYILKVKAFDSSITNPMNSPINDNRNVLKIYLTIEDINDNGPIFQPQTNFTPIESSIDNTAISVVSSSSSSTSSSSVHSTTIQCYKVDVIESTWTKSSILQLLTKDLDSPKYSITKYEFDSNTDYNIKQLFKLNEHTGELYLKQPLDYEKHTTYTFNILAIDNDYHRRSKLEQNSLINSHLHQNIFTSTANIIINVIDINDEIPMIELDYLRIDETTGRPATFARIEENIAPPQFIADILVTDRDVNTVNSYVICTLLDKPNRIHDSNSNNTMNTLFQLTEIKRQSGLVQYNLLTINSLDREVNGSIIRPRIQCTDSGLIKKSSEVDIIIHIIDVNDNIPFIQLIPTTTTTTTTTNTTNNSNIINLKENTSTGTIIGYFNITDYDIGDNSRTKCQLLSINNTLSLININEYFFIDPITCNLIINKPIDRELFHPPINQIQLFIEINDYGKPILKSNLLLLINIINENDNRPLFQQNFYHFKIKENLPIGTPIGQLLITDLDGDYNQLQVMIKRKKQQKEVKEKGKEKEEQLPFQLWKSNISSSSSSSAISSSINQYNITNEFNDLPIIIYYINTTKILDYEERSTYEFEIYATDLLPTTTTTTYNHHHNQLSMKNLNDYTTSTTILITIEDENDNDPMIIFPKQSDKLFIITNLQKKYYQLMTVNVNDKDSISNSFIFILEQLNISNININQLNNNIKINEINFINQSKINNFLNIDRNLGIIYLNRDIQYNDTGYYIFNIIVYDNIINPRNASIRFIVKIESIPFISNQYNNNNKINNLLNNNYNYYNLYLNDNYINSQYFDDTTNDYTTYYSNKNLRNYSNPLLSLSSSRLYKSTKQFTYYLTNDTILILSLGLILLILLATLCLIIFARHWSFNTIIQPNTFDKIQCNHLLCCKKSNCKQLRNNNNNSNNSSNINNNNNDKKEIINNIQSIYSPQKYNYSPINLNYDHTIKSINLLNDNLYTQNIINNENNNHNNNYYHHCKQYKLLPIITSTNNSLNRSYVTDYTPLQTITSCKCCLTPTLCNTNQSSNEQFNGSFMIQPINDNSNNNNNNINTLDINQLCNEPISYYKTISPKLKLHNLNEKHNVQMISMNDNVQSEIEKNSQSEYLTT
ncbi:unnamed protein product [Schistosoma rodhaini]|nr:unnamed protein product [Schistosoma rodhaini]